MPSASYGTTFVSGSGAGVDAAGGGEGDLISSSFVVGGVFVSQELRLVLEPSLES